MKDRVKFFLGYGAFWLFFFILARLLFLIYYYGESSELSFSDLLLTIAHGLRLDLSVTGYFLVIPGLLLIISSYIKPAITRVTFHIYTILLLLICSFIVVLDLEIYQYWGFRLDATPLLYVGQDTTIPIDLWAIIFFILMWILLLGLSLIIYKIFIAQKLKALSPAGWKASVVMLLLTGCLIAPIRGTAGVAPINTGTVYFHPTNMFANHAAINVIWNTGYALKALKNLSYPENYLDKFSTNKYFKKLYTPSGKTEKVLNNNRPNVILIIMESFTFRLIEPLGGIAGVTPNFNKLTKEGILFDHMYASGDRTDKGIVSVLNGYPAQPTGSIIKYPKKTQSLPYLNKKFKGMGYYTGFTYGGNIDFANFRSFLNSASFDHLTSNNNFPEELNNSKWGVHDEYVFDKFLKETNHISEPFFKVMLTLSSHEPFDVPMKTVFEGDDEVSKFLNSAYYTDQSLGKFIEKARQSDWWENTLVVITADHGHPSPDNNGLTNPDRFKIPMLWLGGALSKRDTIVHNYGSQTDIPNTILAQLDQPDPGFIFSNNILDLDHHDFAVFVYNNGYGYIDDTHELIYDNTSKRYIRKEGVKNDEDLVPGMAYMQKLYSDYNSR